MGWGCRFVAFRDGAGIGALLGRLRFWPATHAGALKQRPVRVDGSQVGEVGGGGRVEELLGEPDAVQDDRHDVAGHVGAVRLVQRVDVRAEDEADACPLEGAAAEAECLERGEFSVVELKRDSRATA